MRNPWESIAKPHADSVFSYKLADLDHPFEFFWARDVSGKYAFRFKGRYTLEFMDNLPSMVGIDASTDEFGGYSYFNLILESYEDAEIFYSLCVSLMSSTENIDEGKDVAAIGSIISNLKRWQSILKNKNNKLTAEKQIGLFGELLFLRDAFLANIEPYEAVLSWLGAAGHEQDFGYGNSLVEVKTSRTTKDTKISIPSVSQLDTQSGDIFLVFQTLAVFKDQPPNSLSLNGLVEKLRGSLKDHPSAMAEFEIRLALIPYRYEPDYDKAYYIQAGRKIFDVEGAFPRIENSDVREGVLSASYKIRVEDCVEHEIECGEAISRILMNIDSVELDDVSVTADQLRKMPEAADLEFKSSLRWSYNESKVDKVLEDVVVKTVAAMANTIGGRLLIGVNDDGVLLGLKNDYESLSKKSLDGFELHLLQILENAFSTTFCTKCVRINFEKIDDKDVCVVTVMPTRPIVHVQKVTKSGKSSVFYVRNGNSTKELPVEEIIYYNDS